MSLDANLDENLTKGYYGAAMKILLSGYYGFGNTGDEAVLESITLGFKQTMPEAKIAVLSADRRFDFSAIRSCDVFVSGGGSLFQDATSFRSFLYYLGLLWIAKLLGKKTAVFAQGIGPLNNPLGQWLLKLVLNKVDLITVRDEDSLALLKQFGIIHPPIHLAADPVFILTPTLENGERILKIEGVEKDNKIFIGVSARPVKGKTNLPDILAGLCDYAVRNFSAEVVFIPFQCPEDIDEERRIMDRMTQVPSIVFRKCAPREILGITAKMDLMIGMRLHSLIFSAMNYVPCLGVSYDPKVEAFMREVDMPYLPIEEITLEKLSKLLENLIAQREEKKEVLRQKVPELKEKSQQNFELFRQTFF